MKREWKSTRIRTIAVAASVVMLTGCANLGLLPGNTGSSNSGGSTAAAPLPLCDPIGPLRCMVPFPNDYYTVADASMPTGRRINFQAAAMPANSSGVHIDPTEWNRNDGFSPGSAILVAMPGANLRGSGAAKLTDIGASLRPNAPIVIIDTQTGVRWPYWSELDAHTQPGKDRTFNVGLHSPHAYSAKPPCAAQMSLDLAGFTQT